MSRLIWVLGVIVLVVGSIWLYNTYRHRDPLGSGLVISRDDATDSTSKDSPEPDAPTSTQPPPTPPTAIASSATQPQQTSQPAPKPAVKPSTALPTSDSIDRNPPNGTVYTATGKYTWYRQGDITWRVDSATGSSCIAFATLGEWQKRIVYTHGCRNA